MTRTVQDTVTANGRYSMDVAGTFPEARGTRFSVLVEGVSSTAALVVERASYSSTPTTPWAAGTNSLAMPLPSQEHRNTGAQEHRTGTGAQEPT